jgi:DNA modification methylase
MVGSGTTLVEARLMGRHALGFDIDPLALLIARTKCSPLCDDMIAKAYERIVAATHDDLRRLSSTIIPSALRNRATPPQFLNSEYWFNADVAHTLALLLWHINATSMPQLYRNFFWVAFSSLILAKVSVANARDIIHSRHHHIEHPVSPDVMKHFATRVKVMRRQMAEFHKACEQKDPVSIVTRAGDAKNVSLVDESVDLVFTSPPYATALDYPRAHYLAVAWLQKPLGVDLKHYMADAPSYIGAVRGNFGSGFELDDRISGFDLAASVVRQLVEHNPRQAKLTQRYFADMSQVLREMSRVLKPGKHAILVVCPSHIRKVQIPTHEVLIQMAGASGLRLKQKYTRTINERRRLLPYMQEAFGQRMSTEYVLILSKK